MLEQVEPPRAARTRRCCRGCRRCRRRRSRRWRRLRTCRFRLRIRLLTFCTQPIATKSTPSLRPSASSQPLQPRSELSARHLGRHRCRVDHLQARRRPCARVTNLVEHGDAGRLVRPGRLQTGVDELERQQRHAVGGGRRRGQPARSRRTPGSAMRMGISMRAGSMDKGKARRLAAPGPSLDEA